MELNVRIEFLLNIVSKITLSLVLVICLHMNCFDLHTSESLMDFFKNSLITV